MKCPKFIKSLLSSCMPNAEEGAEYLSQELQDQINIPIPNKNIEKIVNDFLDDTIEYGFDQLIAALKTLTDDEQEELITVVKDNHKLGGNLLTTNSILHTIKEEKYNTLGMKNDQQDKSHLLYNNEKIILNDNINKMSKVGNPPTKYDNMLKLSEISDGIIKIGEDIELHVHVEYLS